MAKKKLLIRAFSTHSDIDVDIRYALVSVDDESLKYLSARREIYCKAEDSGIDDISYIAFCGPFVDFYEELKLESLTNEQREAFDRDGYVEVSEEFGVNEAQARTEMDELIVNKGEWYASCRERYAPQEIQTKPIPFEFLGM